MRVRRDISSIPYQSASETWAQIISLVTGPDSVDAQQIIDAGPIICSVITDEHLASSALLIEGVGPQLRLYCRYGMKAIEEGGTVDRLTWNPTAGDWTMRVPCDSENLTWVRESLAKISRRMEVFDVAAPDIEEAEKATSNATDIIVDWDAKG